jgi:acetaldehyde dehydrogenase/alcohol dehydrogenase
MPRTVADVGIDPEAFRAALDELAMAAFRDPSLRTNPRMPLVSELRQLLASVSGDRNHDNDQPTTHGG